MIKVITYGTYDLLHYGHIRLLERAKALGDYLIVGVTADTFDLTRGKINVQQSLMERIEAVKATGIADEIIIEEYEGQKIDDIKKYGIDIFTVGSDWKGKFDYLEEFCKVVYLERTQGVSSSNIRSEQHVLRIGMVGESTILNKFERESHYVNGIKISGVFTLDRSNLSNEIIDNYPIITDFSDILELSDAIYLVSHPSKHYEQIKRALENNKHVLCESPITLDLKDLGVLNHIANKKGLILMDSLKTAYSTAYSRLVLLAKSGVIGDVISVDTTCTSLQNMKDDLSNVWNSICAWGPTAMLPIFQLLGTNYVEKQIVSHVISSHFDTFTKVSFVYPHAVASLKVGKGVKSEGELIVSGTKGYIYVPAPWWKTDYFEIRYENPIDNRRYFYQLDGEGIRMMILMFAKSIENKSQNIYLNNEISAAIVSVMQDFYQSNQLIII